MSFTLKGAVQNELIIKKSRFMAWVEPVSTPELAKSRIEELRKAYPDARHVCFAFYVNGQTGLSDDGEPSGTAAKPMFNVLNHKQLVNVVAVVVRYFGGIKLGAGGLSRAYGKAISEALGQAEYQVVEAYAELQVIAPFALESQLRRVCDDFNVSLQNLIYKQQVEFSVTVAESQKVALADAFCKLAPGDPSLSVNESQ